MGSLNIFLIRVSMFIIYVCEKVWYCVEYISIYVRLCKGDYFAFSGVCSEMLVYV